MAKKQKKVRFNFFLDPIGNTFSIWWDDKNKEAYSDFSDFSDDVIVYDNNNKPIGIEKINFFPSEIKDKIAIKAIKSYLKFLPIPEEELKLLLQK
ncbi:hypothetical protein A3A46_01325 [Candidatus Roizmanbacteria bacterium RIFCSPLOWO2_01_FULL_37_13]|uniref:DUF2283 domain-containing protein n=1 Tax=Candidatus Roizmanbacteria bacterium RIFCSPHIGHO2_02_FULL_38_11 TaxID=1802039 RepID=A0A1F7GZU3_9BACT|nr:MAG: hypothetical protein A3C25_01625 [Candidatus Roizmanbacteria bacterium RIFCSPHIGHO2_02_FULL_38_11]OGK32877.1 MAG: hypothetical protein A3F58_01165 [Candidatus Roizmanbacteria bacterium RIFCSPHIGHO2_12_FULL_37_9b]OGK42510.1 MAG: hypothetical protein A3A46_01325 [Candidatus Roizmanbacteria bacterium RIFCSPLOWO2_01_FULL_37_13]